MAALGMQSLETPSSSFGHRAIDELPPTVVVLETVTQCKAPRTVATFGVLVAVGTGDFLDCDQQ
jgi:hypothetical protein